MKTFLSLNVSRFKRSVISDLFLIVVSSKMCQITILNFSIETEKAEKLNLAHFLKETTEMKKILRLTYLYSLKD